MSEKYVLRGLSIGSLFGGIALIVLAFLPRPDFSFSHYDIFVGIQKLNGGQLNNYRNYLRNNLIGDNFYLLGNMAMWVGFGIYIAKKSKILSSIVIVGGIISSLLDFIENCFRWAIFNAIQSNICIESNWGIAWDIIYGLSLWTMFIVLIFVIIGVYDRNNKLNFFISLIGILWLLTSINIHYYGFFFSFIGMIIWHISSAFFLWKKSNECLLN